MASFEAKEIERQAGRVEEQLQVFNVKANTIINNLDEMSKLVKSEDSGLSNTLFEYSQTYQNIQTSLKKNFTSLATIMHNYVRATLRNESNAEFNMKSIDEQLETIKSMFSTIKSIQYASDIQDAVAYF